MPYPPSNVVKGKLVTILSGRSPLEIILISPFAFGAVNVAHSISPSCEIDFVDTEKNHPQN